MRLSNENRGTANYACSSKPKKGKPNEQRETGGIEKGSDNKGENRKQKVKECRTCRGKHQEDCWHLKTDALFVITCDTLQLNVLNGLIPEPLLFRLRKQRKSCVTFKKSPNISIQKQRMVKY